MFENDALSFLEKVFLVLIVLSSCTTIVADFGLIRYVLVALYFLLVGMGRIELSNHKGQFYVLAVFLCIWLAQMIWFGNANKLIYIFKIFALLLMMATYSGSEREKNGIRLNFIVNSVFIFSLASNIVYVLLLVGIQLPKFVTSLELYSYFYLLQEFYDPMFGFMSYRNNGIYWEPGVYQVFLNFLLLYVLFRPQEKRRILKIVYLVIFIISTGSVTGIISCAVILFIKCFEGSYGYKRALLAIIAVLAMAIISPIILDSFILKKETLSFEYRMGDLRIGLNQFLHHPIIGKGVGDESYAKAFLKEFGFERTNSNGIVEILLSTGLFGMILYSIATVKSAHWFENRKFKGIKYAFYSWIIISLMNEPIEACAFMLFVICIGWHSDEKDGPVFQMF